MSEESRVNEMNVRSTGMNEGREFRVSEMTMIIINNDKAVIRGNALDLSIETIQAFDLILDTFKDAVGAKESVYFVNELFKIGLEAFTSRLSEDDITGEPMSHNDVEDLVNLIRRTMPDGIRVSEATERTK